MSADKPKSGPKSDGQKRIRTGSLYMLQQTDRCIKRLAKDRGFTSPGKLMDSVFAPHVTDADRI